MILVPIYVGRRDRAPIVIAHAKVDGADAARILRHHWTLDPWGYAGRRLPRPSRARVLMHREILGDALTVGLVADHINRDKLDNRRANLRAVTRAANNQNRDAYANGVSRFRGVCWSTSKGRWRATAQAAGEWKHIGYFDTELDAALAATAWRSEHMPWSFEEIAA